MDLRLLRFFHSVARMKSFTKAADALAISQPALSQGVKNLESELHCRLFVRGKTLQLTAEGEKLYAHCEEVFQVLEKIVDDIANAGNPRKGAIKVGVLESVLMYWLPKILGEYFQKHPGVTIAFEKAETTTIESGVIDEKFHLGIISRPAFSRKLDEVELGSFPHKLVVSNAFTDDIETLASRLPLYLLGTWQEQALTSGTTLFTRIPDVQRLNPINCAGLVRQIVANGLGMAVLPSYIVGPDLRVIEEFPQMRMRLHLIRRKSRRPAPIADQFAAFIEQSARS